VEADSRFSLCCGSSTLRRWTAWAQGKEWSDMTLLNDRIVRKTRAQYSIVWNSRRL